MVNYKMNKYGYFEENEKIKTIPSTPQASMLLNSLRSVGYTEEAAIADIVDNSVSADASEIHIHFDWNNRLISVTDNGKGMSQEELYKNMQIGSANPNEFRSDDDLGRFGMGLKTAAFSLGRKVTVVTAQNGIVSNAAWDLDKVDILGWQLIIDDDKKFNQFLDGVEHSTAVIISNLDNLISEDGDNEKIKTHFYKIIKKVANHLSLVFHRFIDEDGLKIFVNEEIPIKTWNPFVLDNPATQELSDEEIWNSANNERTYIQPYVLPHKTKFSSDDEYNRAAGYKGWSRHQGIYLYRNRRLIIYGTWFELIRKEPAFNLARIRIDISSSADADWKIDIKKSRASLPVYLRDRVLSSIEECTQKSARVFNSRGAYTKKSPLAPNLDFVWEQVRNHGNYTFKINKKHSLLSAIREQLDENGKMRLNAYLSLLENFAPFMRNNLIDTINTGVAQHDDFQTRKNLADIKSFVKTCSCQGFSKEEICDVLIRMPEYAYLKDEINRILEDIND